ncbi:helix-turn-helix domain-containing protein [Acidisoma silvae]|uniref:Helix-turn-helix domain-containing protein n=1 Tax=Acidisoma silvae TaxID=2802396 RepID=A0A964E205_9PROT|nr:helix-turn-helix domain-containing protein [Acidisoma silvae]
MGLRRSTFRRWCELYRTGGPETLAERPSAPDRIWNRIPDDIRARIIDLALEAPELSPREIAELSTDEERYLSRIPRFTGFSRRTI